MQLPALFVTLSGGESILDVDATILIQFAIFAVAFLLFRPLIFRPLMAVFDARDAAIDGARQEAKDMEAGAKQKAEAFETEMRRVRAAAQVERDRLRADAAKSEKEIVDRVRAQTTDLAQVADAKLRSERAKLSAELNAQAPTLARQIASKLLGREVA